MGGLVGGTFATFETENEIGTSALLFVGVLAGVIALLRRVPKIKLGDNELDPTPSVAANDVADAAIDAALAGKPASEVAQAARETATLWLQSMTHDQVPRLAARADHFGSGGVRYYDIDDNLIAVRIGPGLPLKYATPDGREPDGGSDIGH